MNVVGTPYGLSLMLDHEDDPQTHENRTGRVSSSSRLSRKTRLLQLRRTARGYTEEPEHKAGGEYPLASLHLHNLNIHYQALTTKNVVHRGGER